MDEASNSYIVDLVGWVRRVNCVAGGLGFNSGRVLTLLSLFLCFFVSLSLQLRASAFPGAAKHLGFKFCFFLLHHLVMGKVLVVTHACFAIIGHQLSKRIV